MPTRSQSLSQRSPEPLSRSNEAPVVLGLADGVGAWRKVGVNPAAYPLELMAAAFDAVTHNPSLVDPVQILDVAFRKTKSEGSSTACLVVLHQNIIRTCNLGDSGILILRRNEVLYRSVEQVHAFNQPYQLGSRSRDLPKHASTFSVAARAGDVVLMGTDGLFDNLFDDAIRELLAEEEEEWTKVDLDRVAMKLASHAFEVAQSPSSHSPYAAHAQSYGKHYEGGKMDDITVLLAVAQDD